jgi:hypothetical protein
MYPYRKVRQNGYKGDSIGDSVALRSYSNSLRTLSLCIVSKLRRYEMVAVHKIIDLVKEIIYKRT